MIAHLNCMHTRSFAILLIFAMNALCLCGQNLVPNESFENYKILPCKPNEFFIQDFLENWRQPISTSTDYWNTIGDISCAQNPLTINRFPRTGSGMIGIITASFYNNFAIEYKEYIEVKLKETLKKDHFYFGEFYAKNRSVNQSDRLKSNNLAVALSESLINDFSNESPNHLFLNGLIKEENIIEADLTWQKISGCFVADKPYQYLLVGNFDSIDSTLTKGSINSNEYSYAYYFIDDVALNELNYNVSSLLTTTTLCPDQSFTELNASVDEATAYLWEDGSKQPTFKASTKADKDYSVTIFFNECHYKHTFHVENVPEIDLGKDTVLCKGETLKLNPRYSFGKYSWSDGSTDTVKIISSPGLYSIAVQSDYCLVQDSVYVNFIDCPSFGPNVITPNGDMYNDNLIFENIDNRIWGLKIFNRWGEQVYASSHYQNSWSGQGLNDGIYYYQLSSSGLVKVVKGWVQILR